MNSDMFTNQCSIIRLFSRFHHLKLKSTMTDAKLSLIFNVESNYYLNHKEDLRSRLEKK